MAGLVRGPCDCQARDRHWLASKGLPTLLDLEVATKKIGTTASVEGDSRPYPSDVPREPTLGRAANSLRVAVAGLRSIGGSRIEIPDAPTEAAVADMANIPRKSRRAHVVDRFLPRADRGVYSALRVHRTWSRTAADRALRRHGASNRGVGCSTNYRSVPLGYDAAPHDPRSGRGLRVEGPRQGQSHGDRGSCYRTTIAMAKPLCGKSHRLDPAGVPGPRDRAQREAFAAHSRPNTV